MEELGKEPIPGHIVDAYEDAVDRWVFEPVIDLLTSRSDA
jgi:hypothetical protein